MQKLLTGSLLVILSFLWILLEINVYYTKPSNISSALPQVSHVIANDEEQDGSFFLFNDGKRIAFFMDQLEICIAFPKHKVVCRNPIEKPEIK
jgi:hypothetical protein